MGLFDKWFGRPIDLSNDSVPFWRGFFGTGTTSGEVVTYDSALGLDAVWACVNLISNAVVTCPCMVFGPDGVTVADEEPVYDLLHDQPNEFDTASDFWSMAALSLCLDGNFFAEKVMSGGRITAIVPFAPLQVAVKRDERNRRYYEVSEKGGVRKLPPERMLHIRGYVVPGCDRGLSPIAAVRNAVGNAQSGEKTAGKMFAGGMMASTMLSSDQILKPDQRAQIAASLQDFAGADKAGGVLVLEAGLKAQQLSLNPEDAQMLETRQFSVEQICRIFGVPPVMIGHAANGTTTWGSGIEQLILQFTKTCLTPLLKRIEDGVRRDLLTSTERKTLSIKFNMEGLLRGDSAARAEFLSKMVSNSIYTPNEARKYENKAPEDGGDQLIANGTMTPLTMLGHNGGPALDATAA